MSKRAVLGPALMAATLAACSGGHSSTPMPIAGPAAVSPAGTASTASASTAASSGSTQSTIADSTGGAAGASASGQSTVVGGALTYSEFGMWSQPGANPMGGAFITGTETPAVGMPKTGTASYAGGALGVATNSAGSTQLAGTFNATADFGRMTVAGGMNMNQIGANGAQTPYDSYSFAAGFAAGSPHFSGTMTSASNTALTGVTSGSFYGPQAQEIGGTFALHGGGTSVVGAFGGSTTATPPAAFTGSTNVALDFGSRGVNGTMTLAGSAGASSPAGTISLSSGTATFSGSLSSQGTTGSAVVGAASGTLVGPGANTTSGVFTTSGAGTTVVGAFGGAKH